ncbi:MAG: helix-turn-helix transcriptional regulator [Rubrivivax sp.]|nr:helix-turn-helix transcriptional regulator [Rubrivivax sp.]
MKHRGVQLQYRFGAGDVQRGAAIDNPLFDLLSALAEAGSIQQAAQRLGQSYRHLWGSLKGWETTLGEPLVHWVRGRPARLTPFAERLLWAERRARARLAPHIEALRGELQRVLDEAVDGSRQVLRVHASHDLALPALQAMAGRDHGLHVELRFAGSLDALRALAEGRCLVAGFHVPMQVERMQPYARALKPLLVPGRHKLIGCMRRTQGLIVAPGNPLTLAGWPDLWRPGVRFASREAGSGTELLARHLTEGAGTDLATLQVVARENSHLAVAHAVAEGRADAGLGLRAAAAQLGLGFVPLVDEDYFLVCLADALEQPAVRALRDALAASGWADALRALPGYAPSADAGKVLSLTRALPWWRFRSGPHAARPR